MVRLPPRACPRRWVSGSTADLYHVLIYMFLNPGTVDEQGYLFPGQAGVQVRGATRIAAWHIDRMPAHLASCTALSAVRAPAYVVHS